MTTPHISVLIDTYNHERYIEQAIVSVLEQDFPAEEMEIRRGRRRIDGRHAFDRRANFFLGFGISEKKMGVRRRHLTRVYPSSTVRLWHSLTETIGGRRKKLSVVAETFERESRNSGGGSRILTRFATPNQPHEMFIPAKTCRLDLSSIEAARLADAGLTMLGTSRLSIRRDILHRIGPLPEELVFLRMRPSLP